MYSFEDVLKEIADKTGLSGEEVKKKIEEKQLELSGLVSPEGAAYIVGKELGVNLLRQANKDLKIRNIVSGMRSVDITAKVLEISEIREFEKKGKSGSVVNLVLGDDSGTVRFSMWNDEIGLLKTLGIVEDSVVKISGGYAKEDNRGNMEVRLGKSGTVEKLEGKDIEVNRQDAVKGSRTIENRKISDFKTGDYNKVRASLVQVFKRDPFFEVCPECGSRVEKSGGKWSCKEHGEVEPQYHMVVSGVIDDGSGNIRAVFFREAAEKVLGKESEKVRELCLKEGFESFLENSDVMGKEFIMTGRVKENDFTNKMEFVVNDVKDVNVKDEINCMLSCVQDKG